MPFVVDASVAASWLLPDEAGSVASAAYQRLLYDGALVPSIWWFEMRNIFISNERRGRITLEQTTQALQMLARLPIRIDPLPVYDELLSLARLHCLTVYDAAYLALAVRENCALATLDQALVRAAAGSSIPLI